TTMIARTMKTLCSLHHSLKNMFHYASNDRPMDHSMDWRVQVRQALHRFQRRQPLNRHSKCAMLPTPTAAQA
ncbi:hypothetical protein VIGAN_01221200, partial [Vigna angularis var. angularis]